MYVFCNFSLGLLLDSDLTSLVPVNVTFSLNKHFLTFCNLITKTTI